MPPFPSKEELFRFVVSVFHYPWGDLVAAPLSMWLWCGVLLQDMYAFSTVLPVEMFHQSTSGKVRPWSPWEVALSIHSGLGEAELIYSVGGGGGC